MKHFFLLIFLLPLLTVAQTTTKPHTTVVKKKVIPAKPLDGFVINGTVTGFPDGTAVDLLNNQTGASEEQATITNNKFVIKGKMASPDFRILMFNKQQPYVVLFLDNSDIKVTGTKTTLNNLSITGSPSHTEFDRLNRSLEPYQFLFADDAPYDTLAIAHAMEITESFAEQHPKSYASPLAIIRFSQIADDDKKTAELYNALSPQVKASNMGVYLGQLVGQASQNGVGSVLADFTETDTAGNPISLSSFRGKYLLVDFWASWCRPCRQENPNVVAAYNRFKDKNFTILGVSMDKAKQAWVDAIKMDNLTWTHVSDLQGWGNAVAVQFQITQIPQNILLAPDGTVIAKNLRGPKLMNKLAKILR